MASVSVGQQAESLPARRIGQSLVNGNELETRRALLAGHEGRRQLMRIRGAQGMVLEQAPFDGQRRGIVIGAIIGTRSSGASASDVSSARPLELVSMRHQREGTTLTVSGLVHNPTAGTAVNGVTAVVFAFDRNGGFVASGRAPLEFASLAPGDESPFVVAVPNVSDVARYRVSFRTGQGIVRHVDRRSNQVQLAQAVR